MVATNCFDCLALLGEFHDRLLTETQLRALEEHLAACPECRREWSVFRAQRETLVSLAGTPAPGRVRTAVRAGVERELAGRAKLSRGPGISNSLPWLRGRIWYYAAGLAVTAAGFVVWLNATPVTPNLESSTGPATIGAKTPAPLAGWPGPGVIATPSLNATASDQTAAKLARNRELPDSSSLVPLPASAATGGGGARHLDGSNYSFVDGHVKWLESTKFPQTVPGNGTNFTFAFGDDDNNQIVAVTPTAPRPVRPKTEIRAMLKSSEPVTEATPPFGLSIQLVPLPTLLDRDANGASSNEGPNTAADTLEQRQAMMRRRRMVPMAEAPPTAGTATGDGAPEGNDAARAGGVFNGSQTAGGSGFGGRSGGADEPPVPGAVGGAAGSVTVPPVSSGPASEAPVPGVLPAPNIEMPASSPARSSMRALAAPRAFAHAALDATSAAPPVPMSPENQSAAPGAPTATPPIPFSPPPPAAPTTLSAQGSLAPPQFPATLRIGTTASVLGAQVFITPPPGDSIVGAAPGVAFWRGNLQAGMAVTLRLDCTGNAPGLLTVQVEQIRAGRESITVATGKAPWPDGARTSPVATSP